MVSEHLQISQEGPDHTVDLNDGSLYINRHLSWLKFNWRVLCEALISGIPCWNASNSFRSSPATWMSFS